MTSCNTDMYTDDSVQKLDPRSFSRLRPDTYCGSTEDSTQLAVEIVTNSVDEHLIGHCDRIEISYDEDSNVVTVSDNGQGIIPSLYKGEKTVLEMIYGDINVSGKFDKSDDAVYKVSTGAFGIGASLANYLSHSLVATTKRDGKFETVSFEEGLFVSRSEGATNKDEHGVSVSFEPSEEFFTDARPNFKALKKKLDGICCLCPGLTIVLLGETIHHDGIVDIIGNNVENRDEVFSFKYVDPEDETRLLNLAYGTKASGKESVTVGYANYGLIEGGTPFQTIKTQIAKSLTDWGKRQKILKDKETLSVSCIQDDMCLAFNLVSQQIRYDSQTKVRVTSTADNQFIRDCVSCEMTKWMDAHPQQTKAIIDKAILSKRAAEAAKKARDNVKNKGSKSDKVFKMPTKLTDCWTKDRSKAELYLVEGLSAGSGMIAGRDSEFQAIYALRGKCLSVLKTSVSKILENQEIADLIQALGLECDKKTAKLTYDAKKLRYGKIIAAGDGDSDGRAIKALVFNIIWFLCPELVLNGHVYAARPPLFRVTTKDKDYVYLLDEKALQEYKKTNGKKILLINRAKGLGEQDSSELAETLLDVDTRNLSQITVSDRAAVDKMFNDLYGKKVEPRVQFLAEHAEEAYID